MKIRRKDSKNIEFGLLLPTDIFKYEDDYYMMIVSKIFYDDKGNEIYVNAVRLNDGIGYDGRLEYFSNHTNVLKIDGYFQEE